MVKTLVSLSVAVALASCGAPSRPVQPVVAQTEIPCEGGKRIEGYTTYENPLGGRVTASYVANQEVVGGNLHTTFDPNSEIIRFGSINAGEWGSADIQSNELGIPKKLPKGTDADDSFCFTAAEGGAVFVREEAHNPLGAERR